MITKLVEDTKNQLISKQKSAPKGLWRFNRRNNSKVKNYVKENIYSYYLWVYIDNINKNMYNYFNNLLNQGATICIKNYITNG